MTDKKAENEKTSEPLAKSVIAVASGKGGVGKSTVAANLALALAESGKRVGLLDADLYGPNIPLMLGFKNAQVKVKNNRMIPVEKYGLKIMSIGLISADGKALIWRGPLAHQLITQFLSEVEWGKLDILLIDLPPGTGDVPLSIIQKANLTTAIIVTTPQEASIADVEKMIDMFNSTSTKILGIVENMTHIVCPDCSKKIQLYPNNDRRSISEILGHKLLAEFPFDPCIGLKEADGTPYFYSNNGAPTITGYKKMAETVISEI